MVDAALDTSVPEEWRSPGDEPCLPSCMRVVRGREEDVRALTLALHRSDPERCAPARGAAAPPPLVVLATVHRRESWGAGARDVWRALAAEARARAGRLLVVVVLHPNPALRAETETALEGVPHVITTEPLAYRCMGWLLARVAAVVTDSGGLVEESAIRGVPTIVTRALTERPEAVLSGGSRARPRAAPRSAHPRPHSCRHCDHRRY